MAAPEPELEPQEFRSSAYGLRVRPPRPLQPLVERVERKLAHSLRLVLPRMTAPAARRRVTRKASCAGREPTSASDPAVVSMRSRGVDVVLEQHRNSVHAARAALCASRSASSSSAIFSASGLTSITELMRRAVRVDGIDARQELLDQLARAGGTAGHVGLQPGDGISVPGVLGQRGERADQYEQAGDAQ